MLGIWLYSICSQMLLYRVLSFPMDHLTSLSTAHSISTLLQFWFEYQFVGPFVSTGEILSLVSWSPWAFLISFRVKTEPPRSSCVVLSQTYLLHLLYLRCPMLNLYPLVSPLSYTHTCMHAHVYTPPTGPPPTQSYNFCSQIRVYV